MNESRQAVFLSYASQDAEAARWICEALRSAGIEVWFDQSELRGGDAWDQKIRKQIKECALFVPVISANTQARTEGYFRIEWRLAAQRTHAIAEGIPFLMPVVIDDTPEPAALVPTEFREVQWTRLPTVGLPMAGKAGGELLPAFGERVKEMLAGELDGTTRQRFAATEKSELRAQPAMASRRRWLIPGAAVLAVMVALAMWRPWQAPAPTAAAGIAPRPATRSAELARRSSIQNREELDVVVGEARRAVDASPGSAPAWARHARLEAQYIVRGWDVSEQRRQDTQASALKALAIDPGSTDAMFALATVLLHQRAFSQAEELVRKAIARDPADAELHQALGTALSGQGRDAEALQVRQENLQLFPQNPFTHYDLALSFEKASPPDLEAALRKFDDSLARERTTSAVLHKVALLAGWRGDLPAARQLLDTLDPLERNGDRAVGIAMMLALLEQKPQRVIETGGLTARSYFDDDYVRGPKAWLLAHAETMAGKPTLAQTQWKEAENILRQRVQAAPGNWFDEAGLAVTLAWLGATDEAARIMAPLESVARESPEPLRLLYLAYYEAGRGDAAKTATWLEPVLERRELVTARTLPLDPWWAKLRGQAAFDALGRRPDATKVSVAPPTPNPSSSSR